MRKFLSLTLIIVYSTTQVALGSLAEANLWSERRHAHPSQVRKDRTVQFAQLPAAVPLSLMNQMPPVSATLPSPAQSDSLAKFHTPALFSIRKILDAVPISHASVQEIYEGDQSNQAPVVLLQDIHLNLEAQKNSGEILNSLIKSQKVSLVAVEGAFSTFEFSEYRHYADKKLSQDVATEFLNKNLLAAPSYVGLTAEDPLPAFRGIDDRDLYRENVDAYLKSQKNKEAVQQFLDSRKKTIDSRKKSTFTPSLFEFDRIRSAYHEGKMGLGEYATRLEKYGIEKELILDRYLEAYRQESRLDFDRVEHERKRVIEKLTQALSEAEIFALVNETLAYRLGRRGFGDYYRYLKSLCQTKGVDLKYYPRFNGYIQYVLLSDGIKLDPLFRSLSVWEKAIAVRLATTSEQQSLLEQSERQLLERKLIDFSLTSSEWDQYQHLTQRDSELLLGSFEEFYEKADLRSREMVRRLLADKSDKSQILVVGGFHTPFISRLLKEKKISHLVLSPKITKIENGSGSAYLSVFSQEKTPLDRLFSGEKLFVYPSHLAVGTHQPETMRTETLLRDVLQTEHAAHHPTDPIPLGFPASDDGEFDFRHTETPSPGEITFLHTRVKSKHRFSLSALIHAFRNNMNSILPANSGGLVTWLKTWVTRQIPRVGSRTYDLWLAPLIENSISFAIAGFLTYALVMTDDKMYAVKSWNFASWGIFMILHFFDYADETYQVPKINGWIALMIAVIGTSMGFIPITSPPMLIVTILVSGFFLHHLVNRVVFSLRKSKSPSPVKNPPWLDNADSIEEVQELPAEPPFTEKPFPTDQLMPRAPPWDVVVDQTAFQGTSERVNQYLDMLLVAREFILNTSKEEMASLLSSVTGHRIESPQDLTGHIRLGYYAHGTHKYVFKVTVESKFGEIPFILATKIGKKEKDITDREIQDLQKLNGRGVPRFGKMGKTKDGRVWYVEEFIQGPTAEQLALENKLTQPIRKSIIAALLTVALFLPDAPRDINRHNFMVNELTNEAVMVDLGARRLFVHGSNQNPQHQLLFLAFILSLYGYPHGEKDNRFVFDTFLDVFGQAEGIKYLERVRDHIRSTGRGKIAEYIYTKGDGMLYVLGNKDGSTPMISFVRPFVDLIGDSLDDYLGKHGTSQGGAAIPASVGNPWFKRIFKDNPKQFRFITVVAAPVIETLLFQFGVYFVFLESLLGKDNYDVPPYSISIILTGIVFAFAHWIVEWIQNYRSEKGRLFDFLSRFGVSIVFSVPFFLTDPFPAIIIAIMLHSAYNLVVLTTSFGNEMPVANFMVTSPIDRPGKNPNQEIANYEKELESIISELLIEMNREIGDVIQIPTLLEEFKNQMNRKMEASDWPFTDVNRKNFRLLTQAVLTVPALKRFAAEQGGFAMEDMVGLIQRLHSFAYFMPKYGITPLMVSHLSPTDLIRRSRLTLSQRSRILETAGLSGPIWNSIQPDRVTKENLVNGNMDAVLEMLSRDQDLKDVLPIIKAVVDHYQIDILAMEQNYLLNMTISSDFPDFIEKTSNADLFELIGRHVAGHFYLGILDILTGVRVAENAHIKVDKFLFRGFDGTVLLGEYKGQKIVLKLNRPLNGDSSIAISHRLESIYRRMEGAEDIVKNYALHLVNAAGETQIVMEVNEYLEGPRLGDHLGNVTADQKGFEYLLRTGLQYVQLHTRLLRNGLLNADARNMSNFISTKDGRLVLVDMGNLLFRGDETADKTQENLKRYRKIILIGLVRILTGQQWNSLDQPESYDLIHEEIRARFPSLSSINGEEVIAFLKRHWDDGETDLSDLVIELGDILEGAEGSHFIFDQPASVVDPLFLPGSNRSLLTKFATVLFSPLWETYVFHYLAFGVTLSTLLNAGGNPVSTTVILLIVVGMIFAFSHLIVIWILRAKREGFINAFAASRLDKDQQQFMYWFGLSILFSFPFVFLDSSLAFFMSFTAHSMYNSLKLKGRISRLLPFAAIGSESNDSELEWIAQKSLLLSNKNLANAYMSVVDKFSREILNPLRDHALYVQISHVFGMHGGVLDSWLVSRQILLADTEDDQFVNHFKVMSPEKILEAFQEEIFSSPKPIENFLVQQMESESRSWYQFTPKMAADIMNRIYSGFDEWPPMVRSIKSLMEYFEMGRPGDEKKFRQAMRTYGHELLFEWIDPNFFRFVNPHAEGVRDIIDQLWMIEFDPNLPQFEKLNEELSSTLRAAIYEVDEKEAVKLLALLLVYLPLPFVDKLHLRDVRKGIILLYERIKGLDLLDDFVAHLQTAKISKSDLLARFKMAPMGTQFVTDPLTENELRDLITWQGETAMTVIKRGEDHLLILTKGSPHMEDDRHQISGAYTELFPSLPELTLIEGHSHPMHLTAMPSEMDQMAASIGARSGRSSFIVSWFGDDWDYFYRQADTRNWQRYQGRVVVEKLVENGILVPGKGNSQKDPANGSPRASASLADVIMRLAFQLNLLYRSGNKDIEEKNSHELARMFGRSEEEMRVAMREAKSTKRDDLAVSMEAIIRRAIHEYESGSVDNRDVFFFEDIFEPYMALRGYYYLEKQFMDQSLTQDVTRLFNQVVGLPPHDERLSVFLHRGDVSIEDISGSFSESWMTDDAVVDLENRFNEFLLTKGYWLEMGEEGAVLYRVTDVYPFKSGNTKDILIMRKIGFNFPSFNYIFTSGPHIVVLTDQFENELHRIEHVANRIIDTGHTGRVSFIFNMFIPNAYRRFLERQGTFARKRIIQEAIIRELKSWVDDREEANRHIPSVFLIFSSQMTQIYYSQDPFYGLAQWLEYILQWSEKGVDDSVADWLVLEARAALWVINQVSDVKNTGSKSDLLREWARTRYNNTRTNKYPTLPTLRSLKPLIIKLNAMSYFSDHGSDQNPSNGGLMLWLKSAVKRVAPQISDRIYNIGVAPILENGLAFILSALFIQFIDPMSFGNLSPALVIYFLAWPIFIVLHMPDLLGLRKGRAPPSAEKASLIGLNFGSAVLIALLNANLLFLSLSLPFLIIISWLTHVSINYGFTRDIEEKISAQNIRFGDVPNEEITAELALAQSESRIKPGRYWSGKVGDFFKTYYAPSIQYFVVAHNSEWPALYFKNEGNFSDSSVVRKELKPSAYQVYYVQNIDGLKKIYFGHAFLWFIEKTGQYDLFRKLLDRLRHDIPFTDSPEDRLELIQLMSAIQYSVAFEWDQILKFGPHREKYLAEGNEPLPVKIPVGFGPDGRLKLDWLRDTDGHILPLSRSMIHNTWRMPLLNDHSVHMAVMVERKLVFGVRSSSRGYPSLESFAGHTTLDRKGEPPSPEQTALRELAEEYFGVADLNGEEGKFIRDAYESGELKLIPIGSEDGFGNVANLVINNDGKITNESGEGKQIIVPVESAQLFIVEMTSILAARKSVKSISDAVSGDHFESKTYDEWERLLRNGYIQLSPSCLKIYGIKHTWEPGLATRLQELIGQNSGGVIPWLKALVLENIPTVSGVTYDRWVAPIGETVIVIVFAGIVAGILIGGQILPWRSAVQLSNLLAWVLFFISHLAYRNNGPLQKYSSAENILSALTLLIIGGILGLAPVSNPVQLGFIVLTGSMLAHLALNNVLSRLATQDPHRKSQNGSEVSATNQEGTPSEHRRDFDVKSTNIPPSKKRPGELDVVADDNTDSKYENGTGTHFDETASILNPVLFPANQAIQNHNFYTVYTVLLAAAWETLLFQGVGMGVLPSFLRDQGINSTVAFIIGLLWATVGFVFAHAIVMWWVRAKNYGDSSASQVVQAKNDFYHTLFLIAASVLFVSPFLFHSQWMSATFIGVFLHAFVNFLSLKRKEKVLDLDISQGADLLAEIMVGIQKKDVNALLLIKSLNVGDLNRPIFDNESLLLRQLNKWVRDPAFVAMLRQSLKEKGWDQKTGGSPDILSALIGAQVTSTEMSKQILAIPRAGESRLILFKNQLPPDSAVMMALMKLGFENPITILADSDSMALHLKKIVEELKGHGFPVNGINVRRYTATELITNDVIDSARVESAFGSQSLFILPKGFELSGQRSVLLFEELIPISLQNLGELDKIMRMVLTSA